MKPVTKEGKYMTNKYGYIWWENTSEYDTITTFILRGCSKDLKLVIEEEGRRLYQTLYEEDGVTVLIEKSEGGNLLMQVPLQEFLRGMND